MPSITKAHIHTQGPNTVKLRKTRRSGRDSRQTILPDALRVNANLFQTDLY
jgi:hypothetical protein